MRNKTMKVTAAMIGGLEFSASCSSSDSEFDSIVKSLEGEELELLGDYTEVGPLVQEKDSGEKTVCGKGKFLHKKLQRGWKRRKIYTTTCISITLLQYSIYTNLTFELL